MKNSKIKTWCLLGIMMSVFNGVMAQDAETKAFMPSSIDEMSKAYIKANLEDGNKHQTVAFQNSKGFMGAFDCDGLFITAYGGFRHIDGAHREMWSVGLAWEGIPLYRRGVRQMPDGRIVKDYRCPLSVEAVFSYGPRAYVGCHSTGTYWAREAVGYLKYRIPGLDKATYYRLSINLMGGIGGVYCRFDEEVENLFVMQEDGKLDPYPMIIYNNGYGMIAQALTEIRFRPSKQLAFAIVARGGITTVPGFKANEAWTSLRGMAQLGISIPLTANHRYVKR